MTNAINITTTDKDMCFELRVLSLIGVSHVPHMEYKIAPMGKPVFTVVLAFMSATAINVFSDWLSNQLESHPESETKIENQRITHNPSQITNIIMKRVTINNYYGEKQPEDERVAKK